MSETILKMLRTNLATLRAGKVEPLLKLMEQGKTLTEVQAEELKIAMAEGDALSARIVELTERQDAMIAASKRDYELNGYTGPEYGAGGPHTALNGGGGLVRSHGFGAAYVASQQLAFWRAAGAAGAGGNAELENFSLIASQDGAGKPVAGWWKAADAALPPTLTPLLDACGSERVGSGEFMWVEFPATPPAAAAVDEGAAIPEVTYPPTVRTGQLGKIANQLPLTAEFIEDNQRLQGIIEGALADGVRQKAEQDAEVALVGATLPTSPGTGTLLEELRRGMAIVQTAGFRPLTVVLNPLDYAEIDLELLAKTLTGAQANSPLWALNVVPAAAVTAGTAYVGDTYSGLRVFYRASVQVQITDSHEDEFISDILRIKATQRISTKVIRPQALVKCTAAPTTPLAAGSKTATKAAA